MSALALGLFAGCFDQHDGDRYPSGVRFRLPTSQSDITVNGRTHIVWLTASEPGPHDAVVELLADKSARPYPAGADIFDVPALTDLVTTMSGAKLGIGLVVAHEDGGDNAFLWTRQADPACSVDEQQPKDLGCFYRTARISGSQPVRGFALDVLVYLDGNDSQMKQFNRFDIARFVYGIDPFTPLRRGYNLLAPLCQESPKPALKLRPEGVPEFTLVVPSPALHNGKYTPYRDYCYWP